MVSFSRWRPVLTWGLWALFCFLTVSRFILPWRQPYFEMGLEGDARMHLNYVQWARDPSLYTNDDLLVPSRTVARGTSELLWYRAAAQVSRIFPGSHPEALMSYTFSAIMTTIFLVGAWRLVVSLGFTSWLQALTLILFSIAPINLEGPYITAPMGMNLSRNAYALFPWLLLLLTSSASDLSKGAGVGLAGWMYPFVAIHLGTVEVLRRLSLETRERWRRLPVFILAAALPFSIIIILQLINHGRELGGRISDRFALLLETQQMYFDHVHFLHHWKDHIAFWFVYAFALIGGAYLWIVRHRLPATIKRYLPFYFLPLPFGIIGWFCLRLVPKMFYLQVWRWPIMSCILAIPLLFAVIRYSYEQKHWKWFGTLLLLFLVFLRINAFHYKALLQQVWSGARLTQVETNIFATAYALREDTPKDAIVLAPPEIGAYIRLSGRRAIVVDASDNYLPWFSQSIGGEWWKRMQTVKDAYDVHNTSRLCEVATTYRASVILVPISESTSGMPVEQCGNGYCRLRCPSSPY